jgi:hypothetical protein
MFTYPIYNHNWRNISTVYVYKTRLASNEILSPSNKKHREVGRTKDLSATLYSHFEILLPFHEAGTPVFYDIIRENLRVLQNINLLVRYSIM